MKSRTVELLDSKVIGICCRAVSTVLVFFDSFDQKSRNPTEICNELLQLTKTSAMTSALTDFSEEILILACSDVLLRKIVRSTFSAILEWDGTTLMRTKYSGDNLKAVHHIRFHPTSRREADDALNVALQRAHKEASYMPPLDKNQRVEAIYNLLRSAYLNTIRMSPLSDSVGRRSVSKTPESNSVGRVSVSKTPEAKLKRKREQCSNSLTGAERSDSGDSDSGVTIEKLWSKLDVSGKRELLAGMMSSSFRSLKQFVDEENSRRMRASKHGTVSLNCFRSGDFDEEQNSSPVTTSIPQSTQQLSRASGLMSDSGSISDQRKALIENRDKNETSFCSICATLLHELEEKDKIIKSLKNKLSYNLNKKTDTSSSISEMQPLLSNRESTAANIQLQTSLMTTTPLKSTSMINANETSCHRTYMNNSAEAQISNSNIRDRIGAMLLECVKLADVYKSVVNGQAALSLTTGILVNHLNVEYDVSMASMPGVCLTVLTKYFGMLPDSILTQLVMSPRTYDRATEKSMDVYQNMISKEFLSPNYVCACLCMDQSNKGKSSLVTKPYMALCSDGTNRMRGFQTDQSFSKKQGLGAQQTMKSLVDEISEHGVVKIHCATADNFGTGEVEKILNAIDKKAAELWLNGDKFSLSLMTVKSKTIKDQVYKYGIGWYRSDRVVSCNMHSIECTIKPLLSVFGQEQGLGKDGAVAQNMQSLHHYMDKFSHFFNAINLASVQGDTSRLSEIKRDVRNIYGEVCGSRWMSISDKANKLIINMNVPASESLIGFVADYYGGQNSDAWTELVPLLTCYDSNHISHWMLQFLYIGNHSAGGKSGEGYQRCIHLVCFLAAPCQRVCLKFLAAIYSKHKQWASFFDGKSGINISTEGFGNRVIEMLGVHRSGIVKFVYDFKTNWKGIENFDAVYAFAKKEFERAETLNLFGESEQGVQYTSNDMLEIFESRSLAAGEKMWEFAEKYYIDPMFKPSFSILFAVDPILGCHWAAALLRALAAMGLIELADTEDYGCTATISETSQPLEQWDINCPVYAYPSITYAQFQEKIYDSYTVIPWHQEDQQQGKTDKQRKVEGFIHGHGILHAQFISELKKLAAMEAYIQLQATIHWHPRMYLKQYWKQWMNIIPAITDSILSNFSYFLDVSTSAEQRFTVAGILSVSNATHGTIEKRLSYHYNLRGGIARSLTSVSGNNLMDPAIANEIPTPIIKLSKSLTGEKGKIAVLDAICKEARKIEEFVRNDRNGDVKSNKSLHPIGKRNAITLNNQDASMAEMDSNARGEYQRASSAFMKQRTRLLSVAFATESQHLPEQQGTIFEQYFKSKIKEWKTFEIKEYLKTNALGAVINISPNDRQITLSLGIINKAQKNPRNDAPADTVSLPDMIIGYWSTLNFSTEQLMAINISDYSEASVVSGQRTTSGNNLSTTRLEDG